MIGWLNPGSAMEKNESGSRLFLKKFVDPHIFADLDPGSQNLADPMDPDPDPKHCFPFIE